MKEIQDVINGYMQSNKYITCLEEIYALFEKHNVSFLERNIIMKEIYKYNKKIYALEHKKSQKLDKMAGTKQSNMKSVHNELPLDTNQIKPKKIVESLQCDITPYMKEIKEFNNPSELKHILPTRDSDQFDNVIDMILTNLYHEKVEMINLIHEYQSKDSEIQTFFDADLEDLDFRIESLLDYKNSITMENIEQTTTNKIIFLKNSLGEPMIMSSLKGYEEYYDSFLDLLNSIMNGTFKNIRAFNNNNKIVDLMEVKGFKTRILFSRLKDNVVIVMPAFVKKCDTDLRHRNLIQKVSQVYQSQKEALLSLIDNQEYMKQEEKYLNELMEMLKEKRKVNVK